MNNRKWRRLFALNKRKLSCHLFKGNKARNCRSIHSLWTPSTKGLDFFLSICLPFLFIFLLFAPHSAFTCTSSYAWNCLRKLWWWHIEVKKPWYDKCKNHTSEQKIQEAMAMPKSMSFCWRSRCWECSCSRSNVIVAHLLCWLLIRSINISGNRMTNFTGPIKISAHRNN